MDEWMNGWMSFNIITKVPSTKHKKMAKPKVD
jgi:hypothetical protein